MNSLIPHNLYLQFGRFRRNAFSALLLTAVSAAPLLSQKTAHVQINLESDVVVVPAAGYGVHTSVYDNNFTPADLSEKLKVAGVTALRYPGGSYSDAYHWKTHSATVGTTLYINPNDTFDHFMTQDVLPLGAQAVITVNYGSNAAGTGGGDPAEAADWVRYANVEKKWNIRYWEIGNEIGGNGFFGPEWEEDLHAPKGGSRKGNPALSQSAYGKNTLEFIRAMKAVDPAIKIGVGVDMPDSNPGSGNEALLKEVKDKIDFVIIHWYPKASSTDLTVTEDIKPQVAALRDEIAKYVGEAQRNMPLAITETSGGGSGAGRAIFATDTYLSWFEVGAINVDWLELHAGFLSDVKEVPNDTPGEAYYGMQMASIAARPGDLLVEAQSSTPMLSAHAVRRKDGGVAVVLINKHPNQPYQVDVTIPGAALASTGTRYDFGRANFSVNSTWASSGPTQSKMEQLGNSFSVTVPSTSEAVLLIPAK
jgi:alpha-L-arabinofuranosidase